LKKRPIVLRSLLIVGTPQVALPTREIAKTQTKKSLLSLFLRLSPFLPLSFLSLSISCTHRSLVQNIGLFCRVFWQKRRTFVGSLTRTGTRTRVLSLPLSLFLSLSLCLSFSVSLSLSVVVFLSLYLSFSLVLSLSISYSPSCVLTFPLSRSVSFFSRLRGRWGYGE